MTLRTGTELFAELRSSRLLPTGCANIDTDLLRGGLREGHLIEICGESASGKTQLCLTAAAQTLLRGERVVWLDSGCAFSPPRLVDVLCSLHPGAAADPGALDGALSRVLVAPVHHMHALLDAVGALLAETPLAAPLEAALLAPGAYSSPPHPLPAPPPRLGLVVCDSLAQVAAPLLGPARHACGAALLAAGGAALKELAAAAHTPVLVTNTWRGGAPGLGHAWRAVPHARLHLRLQAPDLGQRREGTAWGASLLQGTHVGPSATTPFGIGPAGAGGGVA